MATFYEQTLEIYWGKECGAENINKQLQSSTLTSYDILSLYKRMK
jgi:hypothetical protein